MRAFRATARRTPASNRSHPRACGLYAAQKHRADTNTSGTTAPARRPPRAIGCLPRAAPPSHESWLRRLVARSIQMVAAETPVHHLQNPGEHKAFLSCTFPSAAFRTKNDLRFRQMKVGLIVYRVQTGAFL